MSNLIKSFPNSQFKSRQIYYVNLTFVFSADQQVGIKLAQSPHSCFSLDCFYQLEFVYYVENQDLCVPLPNKDLFVRQVDTFCLARLHREHPLH